MNWLRNFMRGRYGPDQLGVACLVTYLVLTIANRIVLKITGSLIAYYIIEGVSVAVIVLAIYRMLSRKINKRYAENQVFMKIWNRVKSGVNGWKQSAHNHKVYKYCKCPACRIKIRVPKGKGKLEITCPKCGRTFIKKS